MKIVGSLLLAGLLPLGLLGWLTADPVSWTFVERNGGLTWLAPQRASDHWVLPVEFTARQESGRVVRRIELKRRGRTLYLRVVMQVVDRRRHAGAAHLLDLSTIPGGAYELHYGAAGRSEHRLGVVEVPR